MSALLVNRGKSHYVIVKGRKVHIIQVSCPTQGTDLMQRIGFPVVELHTVPMEHPDGKVLAIASL